MNKKLESYILVCRNAISQELCGRIINDLAEVIWDQAGMNIANNDHADKSYRNTMAFNLTHNPNYDTKLFEIVTKAFEKYEQTFGLSGLIQNDSGYEILKYEKGGFYKDHYDDHSSHHRVLSLIGKLNDNYDGGELMFWKKFKIDFGKGDVVLFPSNFMYNHQVTPVTNGTRYTFITWGF